MSPFPLCATAPGYQYAGNRDNANIDIYRVRVKRAHTLPATSDNVQIDSDHDNPAGDHRLPFLRN